MSVAAEQPRRLFRRSEYERMAELGILGDNERLELIEGEIIPMSPQGSRHVQAVALAQRACERAFGTGYWVRAQFPLAVGETSMPEPDIAVVRGNIGDYPDQHPDTALLVIEASDTTLGLDRVGKASMYAKERIPEYWIQNLLTGTLEVRRDPVPLPTALYGSDYASITIYQKGQRVAPLERPQNPIPVDELLP